MSFLVERLAEITRHLDHLRSLRPRISSAADLRRDLSLHAVRNLAAFPEFREETVEELAALPGFRNVLLHGYVTFNLDRAVSALDRLDAVQDFARVVAQLGKQLD